MILIAVLALNTSAQENIKNENVYFNVDEMPEFPGGEKALINFLKEKISYPEEAKKQGIQGKVFVSFVVDENGKITSARIERSAGDILDKEALRVINLLPEWKPGKNAGVNVNTGITIPINFELAKEEPGEK